MPTITAGGTPQTIKLPEGQVLNVSGVAGAAGMVYRLDPILGGTNSLQSWPVGTGALASIGPYAGEQRFLVSCSVGSVDVAVASAILSIAPATIVPGASESPVRVVVGGDSISEMYDFTDGNGASIVAPGVARVTFAAAFPGGAYWPGDPIKVVKAPLREANQMSSTVLAVDPARLWLEYGVSRAQECAVLSSAPSVYRKYAIAFSSYIAQAFALAGRPYRVVTDAAMAGGDSIQVGEVMRRDWQPNDVAIYAPGMNDVYARGWSFAQIRDNDIANLTYMRNKTPRLIISSIPARSPVNNGWSAERYATWRQVNEWRQRYAAEIGATFINWSASSVGPRTYSDPFAMNADTFTNGAQQTSIDGVHPIGLGGVIGGAGFASSMKVLSSADPLPASAGAGLLVDDYVFPNPMLIRSATPGGADGAATFQNLAGVAGAEIADNCMLSYLSGSGAAVIVKCGVLARSQAVHGDVLGNVQRIIVDNTAGAATANFIFRTDDFKAAMRDGDTVDYGLHLLTSSAATPGSGDPDGLISYGVTLLDQHAVALNKSDSAIGSTGGTGCIPSVSVKPIRLGAPTRRVAVAGAFSSTRMQIPFSVAAGKSACIDLGRILVRRGAKV
ncbi:hypothetical protein O3297_09175 [Janthinobacterium sp. SUN128]|uniref:hypothetical protein n=1 Tax=Janthinobacterium sp. SUN128 TaxID=3014790 RepID=UPI0027136055|nr:hypothetical protein [Janthinobacterium sp. SUN128]MDO8033587.1 hypothetical protein [Janthinobacterium sp. SUN128]